MIYNTSIQILFLIWKYLGLKAKLIDIKTLFLHGELKEELYLETPEGYKEYIQLTTGQAFSKQYIALLQAIYGLVQAAKVWWKKFMNMLTLKINFKKIDNKIVF